MNVFDALRDDNKTEWQFETLTLRYRRLARDYASIARSALSEAALWDGGGAGASIAFWKMVIALEHKREGIRVGVLGDLINAIEVAGDSMEPLVDLADAFAEEHNLDWQNTRIALISEMLRRYVVNGITMLKKDGYGETLGPTPANGPNASKLDEARELLRLAVALDER